MFEVSGMHFLSMFLESTAEDKVSVFENCVLVKSRPCLRKTYDFTRFNRQLLIGFLISFEDGFLNHCSFFLD